MTDGVPARIARIRVAPESSRAAGPVPAERVPPPPLHRSLLIGWAGAPLAASFVLTELNSKGALGFLAPQSVKAGSVAVALLVVVIIAMSERARWHWSAPQTLALVYAAVVTTSTLFADLPVQRVLLLGQFLGLLTALLVFEALRPGRGVGVLFWTAVAHCVLAVIINDDSVWVDGRTRLAGGTHPILLGFEATMVLLVCAAVVLQRGDGRVRVALGVLAVFALYVDLRTYTRESLISALLGLAVLLIAVPGRRRLGRAAIVACALVGGAVALGIDGIVSSLGADSVQQLSTATGRTTLWQRLLSLSDTFPPTGYGYVALNDGVGPDSRLFAATAGTPAENAVIQAFLDGGVVGLVAWSVTMVVCFAAILRAGGPVRALALCTVPAFLISVAVSSDLAGEGIAWYWLIAVAAACAWSRRARGGDRAESTRGSSGSIRRSDVHPRP